MMKKIIYYLQFASQSANNTEYNNLLMSFIPFLHFPRMLLHVTQLQKHCLYCNARDHERNKNMSWIPALRHWNSLQSYFSKQEVLFENKKKEELIMTKDKEKLSLIEIQARYSSLLL